MELQRKLNKYVFIYIVTAVLSVNLIQAQALKLVNESFSLKVLGTSSLHDWEVEAEEQKGTITLANAEAGEIGSLAIEVVAESLKSGKSSMDKNTYKALKTKEFKSIYFNLVEVKNVASKGNGVFAVQTVSDLTIAGAKKQIPLNFTMSVVGNKVKLEGETKFKMTEFKIDPPKALLGTITTGDDVTIKFVTNFN